MQLGKWLTFSLPFSCREQRTIEVAGKTIAIPDSWVSCQEDSQCVHLKAPCEDSDVVVNRKSEARMEKALARAAEVATGGIG